MQLKQATLARTGTTVVEVGASNQVPIVNKNFQLLDASAFGGMVKDKDLATPPTATGTGNGYIVAASPTGLWAGKAKYLAYDYNSAWVFFPPSKGMRVLVEDEGVRYTYDGTNWVLETASSTVAEVRTWVTKTADFTPSTSEAARYLVDATSGPIVISLPAVAGVPNTGWIFKRIDTTANAVTLDANGSELIDAELTAALDPWVALEVTNNGSRWLLT